MKKTRKNTQRSKWRNGKRKKKRWKQKRSQNWKKKRKIRRDQQEHTKEVLKMEAKSLLTDNWKMQKQRVKKTSTREETFFWNIVLIWEKKWENIFGELFQKMVRDTNQKHNFYIFCFWDEKNIKIGKKETKPDSQKRRKDWKRGRENKQHISGRVFLNPSLTSHQKGKNKEKRFILQSCKHMQKGNFVFHKLLQWWDPPAHPIDETTFYRCCWVEASLPIAPKSTVQRHCSQSWVGGRSFKMGTRKIAPVPKRQRI